MSESQPDFLGGKSRPGRRTPKIRRNAKPRIAPAGHADKPGTGPEGRTCGGCHWMTDYRFRKLYHKCGARPGDPWKGGRATDIRPLDAACSKYVEAGTQIRGHKAVIIGYDEAAQVPSDYFDKLRAMSPVARDKFLLGDWAAPVKVTWGGTGGGKTDRTNAEVRAAVLELIAASPAGMTADECAARLGLDPHSLRPRVTELGNAGAIEKTAERRATGAGRTATVWKAKGRADASD